MADNMQNLRLCRWKTARRRFFCRISWKCTPGCKFISCCYKRVIVFTLTSLPPYWWWLWYNCRTLRVVDILGVLVFRGIRLRWLWSWNRAGLWYCLLCLCTLTYTRNLTFIRLITLSCLCAVIESFPSPRLTDNIVYWYHIYKILFIFIFFTCSVILHNSPLIQIRIVLPHRP